MLQSRGSFDPRKRDYYAIFMRSFSEFVVNCSLVAFLQQLVVKAVSLAIARDGASGGVVRTVVVSFSFHQL